MGEESATGLSITERSSLGLSAFYQGVTLIAGMVSVFPCHLYERTASGREEAVGSNLYRTVHDEPNPESTWSQFVMAGYLNKLTYGNRYAEIELTNGGRPAGPIWHIPSHLVTVRRAYKRLGSGVTFDAALSTPEDRRRGGTILYEVKGTVGGPTYLRPEQMFHVPDFSFDGLVGLSRVLLAKESIAVGIARLHAVAAIYGNDSTPGGVLQRPATAPALTPVGERNLIGAFESAHGGVTRKGRLAVLQEGTEFKPLSFSPKDSMVIEAAQLSGLEMAQFLNLNPYWLGLPGSNEKYANLEQEMTLLVVRTLLPHLRADEQEFNRKLFVGDDRDRYFVEYDPKGLLRGDSTARAAFYQAMQKLRVMTPNMIAASENFPKVPADQGGDDYGMPQPATVRETVQEGPGAAAAAGEQPEPTPPKKRAADAFRPVMEAAWKRAIGKETAAIRKALARGVGTHAELRETLAEFYRGHQEFAAGVIGLPVAETVARHHGELLALIAGEAIAADAAARITERLDLWDRDAAAEEATRSLAAMQ